MSPSGASRNSAANFGLLRLWGVSRRGTGNSHVIEINGQKPRCLVALAAALPGLAGCGIDDVQLNGKIFDAVGLNSTVERAAIRKSRLASRSWCRPGSIRCRRPEAARRSSRRWPKFRIPIAKQKVSQAELEKQQAEYCKVHYEEPKARGDNSADSASGPLGLVPSFDIVGRQEVDDAAATNGDDTIRQ